MIRIRVFVVLTISGLVSNLCGQEAAQSTVDLTRKANEQNPATATATPAPTPAPELPELPELSQLDEIFKQTSLGTKADQYRMHVEWRRLRNRLANDPEIVAAKKAADAARTDFEKRERLRHYYSLYYKRMEALTDRADIKAGLEEMKAAHVELANQNRVRPSPSPSAAASPASSPGVEATPAETERPSPLTSPLPAEPSTPSPAPTEESNEP